MLEGQSWQWHCAQGKETTRKQKNNWNSTQSHSRIAGVCQSDKYYFPLISILLVIFCVLPLQFGNESLSLKLEEQISENEDLRNKYGICFFKVLRVTVLCNSQMNMCFWKKGFCLPEIFGFQILNTGTMQQGTCAISSKILLSGHPRKCTYVSKKYFKLFLTETNSLTSHIIKT